MAFRVFTVKLASSWAKPASWGGFCTFSGRLLWTWAIQFKRAYLRESIQPAPPRLNRIPHF